MTYVASHPLETEADYAYTGRDGSCKYSSAKGKAGDSGYKNVTPNSASALASAVAS